MPKIKPVHFRVDTSPGLTHKTPFSKISLHSVHYIHTFKYRNLDCGNVYTKLPFLEMQAVFESRRENKCLVLQNYLFRVDRGK
jgi:hypothetical protein